LHDEKGNPGQARKAERRPAITPDMFWPGPQRKRAPAPERGKGDAGAESAASTPAAAPQPKMPDVGTVISLAEAASRAASRMNHPSVRSKRVDHVSLPAVPPEPVLILGEGGDTVDLSDCGNRCSNGVWCQACRADIRAEALRWLQELNVVRPLSGTNLLWGPAWSREFLLADY
jgi:hypothetical protein